MLDAASRMTYDHIVERRVVEFVKGHHEPKHQYLHDRNGIANVRIDGEWDTLELVIGYQRMDKIYSMSGTHTFDIFENGACVPFLKFHRIEFLYTGGGPCVLSYDIVSLRTPEKFEIVYKSQQYTGRVETNMTIQSFPLSFNHPIEKLTAHCEYPVNDLTFYYDRDSPGLPFIQKTKSRWELDFDKSVNFSKLDTPFICVWTPTTNTIRIFATGFQKAQSIYGTMRILCDY
jgi:hypothetical protein